MKLTVYTRTGSEAGREVELDDAVFGIEPNDHAIWLDVRAIQAHMRQGTHKTKERSDVARSTRKLYRQKGTGNARVGSAKSPTRKGGGTIFGPRPHEYNLRVNRKTKQLARRSAVAHKITGGALRVVESLTLSAPRTKEITSLLAGNGITGRVLLLTAGHDDTVYRSARNIPGVSVIDAAQASTLDLLGARTILLQEGAVEALTEALRPLSRTDAAHDGPAAEAAPAVPTPTEVPTPAADEAPASEASTPEAPASDDLTRVKGVGPVFAAALADKGITTFAALAGADLEALREAIADGSSVSDASANEETWAEQARFLAADDQAGLDAYLDSLSTDEA